MYRIVGVLILLTAIGCNKKDAEELDEFETPNLTLATPKAGAWMSTGMITAEGSRRAALAS